MGLFQRFFRKKTPHQRNVTSLLGPQEEERPFVIVDDRQIDIHVPYILPKDGQESHRLDLQHVLLRTVLQENYQAPLNHPGDILDVGCGTGRWAFEMAQTFPQANVVGCDLVEQHTDAQLPIPPNYRFLQVDLLKGLPFLDQSFDFVHQRFLLLAIPALAWPSVLHELVRVTRSGGWVEVLETQVYPENIGPCTKQLTSWVVELGRKRGIECGHPQNWLRNCIWPV